MFQKRKTIIRLRCGDSTAHVHMDAINKETVVSYFALLKEVHDKFDLETHPEQIYNLDETGMPLSPRPSKIAAQQGQKKVR